MTGKKRLRWRRKKVIYYILTLSLVYFLYKYGIPVRLGIESLLETQKCPSCFGENLCDIIRSGEIELEGISKWTVSQLFNVKNVYFARWKTKNITVVLKKLGHDKELEDLNKAVCDIVGAGQDCDIKHAMTKMTKDLTMPKIDIRGLLEGRLALSTINLDKLKGISHFSDRDGLQCSPNQEKVDFLISRCLHHPSRPHLHHLLTLLLLNQEPILSMSFPSSQDWPFPQYFGACGRLAVFEYVGPTIADYHSAPWSTRVGLAHKLMLIARKLTFNSLGLGIYPTDWSADNIAVDDDGRVVIVDAENVIVVNQTYVKTLAAPGWDVVHTADGFVCPDCFSFSVEDLCSHAQVDHNYHGVCQGLLAVDPYSPSLPGGLLHSIPSRVLEKHHKLPSLLAQCGRTSTEGGRIEAAEQLIELLRLLSEEGATEDSEAMEAKDEG